MRTTNPAKAKSIEVTDKVIFPDATEQTTKGHPMRWTANKLLKGAGAGADPTEIDVPAGDMTKAVYDAANKAAQLSTETELTTHGNLTTAHGAVSAATASKMVVRDGSARAKFAAPAAAGDALIKGTRVTVSEFPALTDEKIWKGTGDNVEEVDMPIANTTKASDTLRNSNDTEKVTVLQAYTKLKEIKLDGALPACRIKLDLRSGGSSGNAHGRIYKNGVAIGTERVNTTGSYVTYSEDFTGFVLNNLIQIYCYGLTDNAGVTQNMRIYYDIDIVAISTTNQDP